MISLGGVYLATIYQTNKKTGITYVIESESYWDKEKQQPRSHRTIIGKINPDTGEIVPTKKYNRVKKSSSPSKPHSESSLMDIVNSKEDTLKHISELEQQVIRLREEKDAILRDLNKVLKQYNG